MIVEERVLMTGENRMQLKKKHHVDLNDVVFLIGSSTFCIANLNADTDAIRWDVIASVFF